MNACPQSPFYIANFADKELRVGLKGLSSEECEARLDAIVRLFCCLHGRDTFIKAYTKYLSTRLLNKTFLSQEAEESMLQKFKVECGLNVVNKMSVMFQDIKVSKDLQEEFHKLPNTKQIDGIEFSAEVLTNGNWPIDNKPTCSIPQSMKSCVTKFESFYKNKYQNRNLTWLYHNGNAELTTNYAAKKYIFVVNVFQATILSLFNEKDQYTVEELRQKTNVPKENFDPGMLVLCNPKNAVLLKEIKKPVFTETEKIKLNLNFKNQMIRLQLLPQPSAKKKTIEPSKEDEDLAREVTMEREKKIEAYVVKIMKGR